MLRNLGPIWGACIAGPGMGVHPEGGIQAGLYATTGLMLERNSVIASEAWVPFSTKYPSPSSNRIAVRSLFWPIEGYLGLEADALGDALADADALLEQVDVNEVYHRVR